MQCSSLEMLLEIEAFLPDNIFRVAQFSVSALGACQLAYNSLQSGGDFKHSLQPSSIL